MIYLDHFQLREAPFSITPDTSFFYAGASSQEALNTLLVAVKSGEGFIKLTGEVGTGKTLLCRTFLASLDESWVTAYIPNPYLEPKTLLMALAEELGISVDDSLDQHRLFRAINHALLNFARHKRHVVLCLDEAQAMPLETIETLRLLTNLETEKRKLLQVILFGQPELDERLAAPAVRQIRQRITFQHQLATLTPTEVGQYLAHRMWVAGYRQDPVFTAHAARIIHKASRGVPRLVNILAHKSLMIAYGQGTRRVGWREIRAAVDDTPASYRVRNAWVWFALLCLAFSGTGAMLIK